MNQRDTKQILFEKGADPIYLKGYHSTGIQEILKAANVPKGSFYFHFKSKEDYVLQLMDYFGDFMFSWMDKTLNKSEQTPLTNIRTFYAEFLEYFQEREYKGGCPIGNLAQEMGDISDSIANKAEALLQGMKTRIAKNLSLAKEQSEIPKIVNVDEIADFMINSWEGAITRTKILRNDSAMILFDKMIFDVLRK
jgi:TetR/AcrR family transcriptional regulator, transcriptional repressor for nem operon